MKHFVLFLLVVMMSGLAVVQAQGLPEAEEPSLLSAYFGLDNTLPRASNRLCRGGAGLDGMPVNFSHPVDANTLQPEDFSVITESGLINTPRCVTLRPATDVGELRTALLIGELGNDGTDAPIRVEIVGDILSGSGDPGNPSVQGNEIALNFIGLSVDVTPLEAGPFIVDAESVPEEEWTLDIEGAQGQGSGCPSDGTVQIIRAVWAGGISRPGSGDEVGDLEREQYSVALTDDSGTEMTVIPFALADLNDGDNNHLLCLDVAGEPVSVSFAAGFVVDPNDDATNPETSVGVQQVAEMQMVQSFRNVRYCEVIPTYRLGLRLRSEVYNTIGLNDCPADLWTALDAAALQEELGAINVTLNGPRYWVLDEIIAEGGVTLEGGDATFGGIEMTLRAIIETRILDESLGQEAYTPTTIQRDTRYIFYAGEWVYTLTSPENIVYMMQSYAQIIDPELTIEDLETLGERLQLPEGWHYEALHLENDFMLLSGGETTVIQDDLGNTYQRTSLSSLDLAG